MAFLSGHIELQKFFNRKESVYKIDFFRLHREEWANHLAFKEHIAFTAFREYQPWFWKTHLFFKPGIQFGSQERMWWSFGRTLYACKIYKYMTSCSRCWIPWRSLVRRLLEVSMPVPVMLSIALSRLGIRPNASMVASLSRIWVSFFISCLHC